MQTFTPLNRIPNHNITTTEFPDKYFAFVGNWKKIAKKPQ